MAENRGEVVLEKGDSFFPPFLHHVHRPPSQLYAIGNTSLLSDPNKLFAIVGTRKPSGYGIQVARLFSERIAAAGFVIVSGMALGIDAVAHTAAVDSGGKTIAVLGGGPDIVYPRANTRLYNRILDNDGLILSEQPFGQVPIKGMFVLRNRIIAGIARGVMVVEGTHTSGSMITGNYACDQGKQVFVAPMPITSPLSQGPLSLFQQGARMVTSPEDILEEYGFTAVTYKEQLLSSEESNILSFLITEDLPVEVLREKTEISLSDLSSLILSLELKGYVMKTLSGAYQRIRK